MNIHRKRDRIRELEEALAASRKRESESARAASRAGHSRDEAIRDAERLLRDLRVVRAHISRMIPTRVTVSFEFADELIYDAFRRDASLKWMLATMIERMLLEQPEHRDLLYGGPR